MFIENLQLLMRTIPYAYGDGSLRASWCGGGTYGSCWSDELDEVCADEEKSLSAAINMIASNFIGYEDDISNNMFCKVLKTSDSDTDWYGGSTITWHLMLTFDDIVSSIRDAGYVVI